MKLRSLVEGGPLFWSTLVSQSPLPLTFAIIIFFISVTEHDGSAFEPSLRETLVDSNQIAAPNNPKFVTVVMNLGL